MALWVQRAMPRMVSCWQHLLLHCMLLTQISPSSWRDSLSARTPPPPVPITATISTCLGGRGRCVGPTITGYFLVALTSH